MHTKFGQKSLFLFFGSPHCEGNNGNNGEMEKWKFVQTVPFFFLANFFEQGLALAYLDTKFFNVNERTNDQLDHSFSFPSLSSFFLITYLS